MDQVKPTYSELEKQVEALKEELRILRGQEEILTDGSLKYDSLIQNHPDLILIQEAHGTTVFISPQVENVIGHDIDTFLGVNFPEFIHPDDRTACREGRPFRLSGWHLQGQPAHDPLRNGFRSRPRSGCRRYDQGQQAGCRDAEEARCRIQGRTRCPRRQGRQDRQESRAA